MAVPVGNGTVLSVSTSTGSMSISKIHDINGPAATAEMADVSSFGDTYRQYVSAGIIDPGQVTLECWYATTDTTQWTRLSGYMESGAAKTFTVDFSTTAAGDTETFSGIVQSIGQAIPMGGGVNRTVGIQVIGDPGFST